MEDNKRTKNKRLIAAVLALGILVISLAGKNLSQKQIIDSMDPSSGLGSFFVDYFEPMATEQVIEEGSPEKRILVIPIHGVIGLDSPGLVDSDSYNHDLILDSINLAREDESIKGVLLDINSPGGTVYHAAEVWHRLKNLQEERDIPIYASMGTLAASGGYYVAAPADKIYAANETTTGSIGVISSFVNYEELAEKIGIKSITFKSGPHKDIRSGTREMTPEEEEILQNDINEYFYEFINVVEDGRGHILSRDEILTLATGRTYSGRQAVKNGLIDEIGYFQESLNGLKEENDLDGAQVFKLNMGSARLPNIFSMRPNVDLNFDTLSLIEKIEESGMTKQGYYYLHGGY